MSAPAKLITLDDSVPPGSFPAGDCVLVVGNFDGVHRGHQSVLAEAVSEARARGSSACVLTFDPHPSAVVGPGAPALLTTVGRRAELMARLGVERVYVRKFDAGFAAWSPDRFARELVSESLRARAVVVGYNFRFGARRAGDLALLQALGQKLAFEVRVHGVARDAKGPYSSTRAREAVVAGDLEEVRAVLGRPHALTGTVVRGVQLGRTLGFPTANLEGVMELLPPNGVYAVTVDEIASSKARALARGVINVGVRPTVTGERKLTIEAHLFDLDRDLYGATLRVHLVARLREERKFEGLEALKAQIARDVEEARRVVASASQTDGSFG
jgi:riboflavin kinase/FMN adenylyltransferase